MMSSFTRLCFFLLVIILITGCEKRADHLIAVERAALNFEEPINLITLGSCNRQNQEQPVWKIAEMINPNLWIWLGDNIYGDSEDPQILAQKYNRQLSHPDYQRFIGKIPVIGTWDDHDFGVNNGGKEFPSKEASKQLALEFLGIPFQNEVWDRDGLYYSYTFGPAQQRVKCILLDSRTFRDSPIETTGGYDTLNNKGDILGDGQWQWLAEEILDSVEIMIIANGIQILPTQHAYEKWANFPESRKRFLSLLEDIQATKIILLSGDRHMSEISRIRLQNHKWVYELTSSGLTHSYEGLDTEENRFRFGDLYNQKSFGSIRIDWSELLPIVNLQIRSMQGKIVEEAMF